MPGSTRRQLLAASALLGLSGTAFARSYTERPPWRPGEAYPPPALNPAGWHYLNAAEVAALEAIADRLIPADELSPGGR